MPFLFWNATWFGRPLTDAQISKALADRSHPREIQHVLTQLEARIESHFFFQAEDGIRVRNVTGVQTCALPIFYSGSKGVSVLAGDFIETAPGALLVIGL